MSQPFFSILMPLYNHESVVGEAIDSVLNQSFTDFELLICDDGSSDQSFDVASTFKDSRIKIWKKNNGGTTTALNTCLLNSSGQVFCWLSSDDIYESHKLMEHYKIHKFEGARFSIANWGLMSQGTKRPQPQDRHMGVGRVLPQLFGNYVNGLSVGINREVFLSHGPFDVRYMYAQDYQRWLKILSTEEPRYIDCSPASFTRLGTGHLNSNNRVTPQWCGLLDNIRALLEHTEQSGLFALIPVEFQKDQFEISRFVSSLAETGCSSANYFSVFGLRAYYASLIAQLLEKTSFDTDAFVQIAKKSHNPDNELITLIKSNPQAFDDLNRRLIFPNLMRSLIQTRFADANIESAIEYYFRNTRF